MLFSYRIVCHDSPAWEEEADARILAEISRRGLPPKYEELAARSEDGDRFTIACIPFFAQDVALGDVVSVEAATAALPVVRCVEQASGHTCFRVFFGKDTDPMTRLEVEQRLPQMGAAFEKYTENLLAVDAPTPRVADQVFAYLDREEEPGHLAFETAHTE